MAAIDTLDLDRIVPLMAGDMEGVDEISKRWMRGRGELEAYLRQLAGAVADVRTSFNDTHARELGDVGIVTSWLEQDYMLEGQPQHVSAPTTMVFHREDGAWKLTLFHSIPLPE